MLLNRIGNWETFDPFKEMGQLQNEMDSIFSNLPADRTTQVFPQFNVWEDSDGLMVVSELPGLEPQDMDISVEGDTLTVKGTKKAPELKEKDAFVKRELFFGNFSRSVKLPFRIDSDQIEANFKNGILTIKLGRPEEEKPKKITVTSN
jgi:HSP20 family protein